MTNNHLIELESAISLSDEARIKELLELVGNLNDLPQSATTNFYFINNHKLVMPFLQKGGSITSEYSEYFISKIITSGQLDALKFMHERLNLDINLFINSISAIELARVSKQNEIFNYLYNNTSLLKSDLDVSYCNHLALLDHPVTDYCPINTKFSVISSLLSNAYSTTTSKESIITGIVNLFNHSSINADVLTISALSLLDNPISIELIDDIQEYDPTTEGERGYCNKNQVVIESQETLNEELFIHELTHNIMNILFDNDSKPCKNEEQKEKFLKSTKATLTNVIHYLNNEHSYNLSFQEQKTTYDIAQMIFSIVLAKSGTIASPKLPDSYYESFVNVMKNNNLLDSSLVLEKFTLLNFAIIANKEELAKALMLGGANTEGQGVMHYISKTNNILMLDWLTSNKIVFNVNEHNCQGKSALDIASTAQLRQALIAKGAVAYPTNYKEICDPVDIDICKLSGQEINLELSPNLNAITKTLTYVMPIYKQEAEYSELIAYFVEINQEKYANTFISRLTEPFHEYWEAVITPIISEYLQSYNMNNHYIIDMICYNFNNE